MGVFAFLLMFDWESNDMISKSFFCDDYWLYYIRSLAWWILLIILSHFVMWSRVPITSLMNSKFVQLDADKLIEPCCSRAYQYVYRPHNIESRSWLFLLS